MKANWLITLVLLMNVYAMSENVDVNSTYKTSTAVNGIPFRLVDGSKNSEGRVELYYDGVWGTICEWSWDIREADMVCRSLGFLGAVNAHKRAYYGKGTGSIRLSSVKCPHRASSLYDCTYKPYDYKMGCNHDDDVGADCTKCQIDIGGIHGINCYSCSINGFGKCDPFGCPNIFAYYNSQTQQCEVETVNKPYECEEKHMLTRSVPVSKVITEKVFSLLECVYLCLMENDLICRGVNFNDAFESCNLYGANKYTVADDKYIQSKSYDHCAVGFCSPGHTMTKNKTCQQCPINTYKRYRGSPCIHCKLGSDTNGVSGAKECRKTCAAGSHSLEGVYCETCPIDTYKKDNDGSQCLKCKKYTTTGGKIGSTQCESLFQHYMNEYGFYYIGVLSGLLAVGSCFSKCFMRNIKRLYFKFKDKPNEKEMQGPTTLSSSAIKLAINENISVNPAGGKSYKIIQFRNKANKMDIDIISDKWLTIGNDKVYSPPPNMPTWLMAKTHAEPSSNWRKCDIVNVVYTSKHWKSTRNKYKKLLKKTPEYFGQFNQAISGFDNEANTACITLEDIKSINDKLDFITSKFERCCKFETPDTQIKRNNNLKVLTTDESTDKSYK